jgi:hypothetical protein
MALADLKIVADGIGLDWNALVSEAQRTEPCCKRKAQAVGFAAC